jgi:hypothetical protein
MPSSDDRPPSPHADIRQQLEQNTWWAYQPEPVRGPCIVAIIEVTTDSVYERSDVESWEPPGSAALHLEPTHPKLVYVLAEESEHTTASVLDLFDRMTNAEFQQLVANGSLTQIAGPRPDTSAGDSTWPPRPGCPRQA